MFERLPLPESDPLGVADGVFIITDTLACFDHVRHQLKLVTHVRTQRAPIEARYAEAVPWPVEPARIGWYALASLVRRLHGAVRRLAWPALDRLERDGPRIAERWLSLADEHPCGGAR